MRYAIREHIDPMHLRYDKDRYLESVKQAMAQQLARAFVGRLAPLEPERDPITGMSFLFFEMMITDRIELDHIKRMGRYEGEMIGQSEALAKIPYGMNPDEVWE